MNAKGNEVEENVTYRLTLITNISIYSIILRILMSTVIEFINYQRYLFSNYRYSARLFLILN